MTADAARDARTTALMTECSTELLRYFRRRVRPEEDAADLRAPLRASEGNELVSQAIDEAIGRKPKGHDFVIDRRTSRPSVSRHMSVTGG